MMSADSYATVVAGGGRHCGAGLPGQPLDPAVSRGLAEHAAGLEYLQAILGDPAHGPGPAAGSVALDRRQLVVLVCRCHLPYADSGLRQDWLHGDGTVVTLVLTLFSVGIALGSLLCERLSGRKVEIGLVPFGSFGLTLFGLLWWWHSGDVPAAAAA